MSDKNPYYSIPKALGERTTQITAFEPSHAMIEAAKLYEKCQRDIINIMCGRELNHD